MILIALCTPRLIVRKLEQKTYNYNLGKTKTVVKKTLKKTMKKKIKTPNGGDYDYDLTLSRFQFNCDSTASR